MLTAGETYGEPCRATSVTRAYRSGCTPYIKAAMAEYGLNVCHPGVLVGMYERMPKVLAVRRVTG